MAFCNLFGSSSRNEEPARPVFRKFYFSHPGFVNLTLTDYKDEEEETDAICDAMMEVAYDLGLSGGEYFYTRVCESVQVYRIPADVLVEQVQFK